MIPTFQYGPSTYGPSIAAGKLRNCTPAGRTAASTRMPSWHCVARVLRVGSPVERFQAMFRTKAAAELDGWIEQAKASPIAPAVRFIFCWRLNKLRHART